MSDEININAILNDPVKYAGELSVGELENLIMVLKDHYYNTDTPLVPDQIYDQIEDVLRRRSPKSKALAAIGAPVKDAVELPYPMPSLNKAKAGKGTIAKWFDKYGGPYLVSQKIDGISIMWYKDKTGKIDLFTRGDGIKGQNISGIMKYIDIGTIQIPAEYNKKEVVVRGELIMPKDVWDKYYGKDHPNVRNFVAGLANAKHPDTTDLKRVQMIAYQLMMPRMSPSDQMKSLTSWGFHVVSYEVKSTLKEAGLQISLETAREQGEYQIDGLVITQDINHPLTEENPKYSIAFKQMDETAQTKVIKVVWRASKRFLLKPRVMIEPVFLSGGTLTYATGHNAKYVVDNKIGPGAMVTIVRSGEVIPYIVSVNRPSTYGPDLPDVDYQWIGEGSYDIRVLEKTPEVSLAILEHMSKVLEIKNLGPGVLKKVIEAGFATPAEVLNMTYENWQEIPSLGKNAEKIWNSLEGLQTKGVWLSQLMDATSIFEAGIGQKKLQLVLDNIPDLLEQDQETLVDKLVQIKGIEKKTAEKIVTGINNFRHFLDEVPQIKIRDEYPEDEQPTHSTEDTNDELEGVRVVFTGVRDKDLEEWITQSGGTVATSISKTHTSQVLVAKDTTGSSNKLKEARDNNVTIYTLAEFKEAYSYPEST